MSGVVTLIAIMLLSTSILGSDAHTTYLFEVLPTVTQWRTEWLNTSLPGLWFKLFDPVTKANAIVPLWRNPMLALAGTLLSCGVLIVLLSWTIHHAKTVMERDYAFGLAITTTLLIAPLSWDFNLVLLLLPLAVMWVRLPASGLARWAWIVVVIALFVPPNWVWRVFIPGQWPGRIATPLQTLIALSFQCYALLGLFVLQMRWKKAESLAAASVALAGSCFGRTSAEA
jgi:hypothetical protein